MNRILILVAVLLLAGVSACRKTPRLSDIPAIELTAVSSGPIRAGSSEDTLFVSFRFKDGNADLGNDPTGSVFDIYLTDLRDSAQYNLFFPRISEDVADPEKGMTGTCTFYVQAAFILLRPSHPDGDTARYSLYIKDRAGNQSNTVYTPEVLITP